MFKFLTLFPDDGVYTTAYAPLRGLERNLLCGVFLYSNGVWVNTGTDIHLVYDGHEYRPGLCLLSCLVFLGSPLLLDGSFSLFSERCVLRYLLQQLGFFSPPCTSQFLDHGGSDDEIAGVLTHSLTRCSTFTCHREEIKGERLKEMAYYKSCGFSALKKGNWCTKVVPCMHFARKWDGKCIRGDTEYGVPYRTGKIRMRIWAALDVLALCYNT